MTDDMLTVAIIWRVTEGRHGGLRYDTEVTNTSEIYQARRGRWNFSARSRNAYYSYVDSKKIY